MKRILTITISCLLALSIFLAMSQKSGSAQGSGVAGVLVGKHSANLAFEVQRDGTHQRTHVLVLNQFALGAGSTGGTHETFTVSHELPSNVKVRWQFSADTGKMTIDQFTFDAANGRVFTIMRNANGTIVAGQLNIDPADVAPTVEAIRSFVEKHPELGWFDRSKGSEPSP